MAKTLMFLILLSFIFTVLKVESMTAQKTWCVAKPSSDDKTLIANIDYACSHVDCSVLQTGGTCSSPNYNIHHASVAMNLYYQTKGRDPWNCDFGKSGLIVTTNPSYGDCQYA